MSVPEVWLRFSYRPDRSDAGEIWRTVLEILARQGLIDPAQLPAALSLRRLDLQWPDVGYYDGYGVRLWETLELEFQWSGRLIEEVTETFCDDVACLAKEIAVETRAEFALAGWEGWFTGEGRPNAWEALKNSPELETVPGLGSGLRHWFYLLGPERHRVSESYLAQLGARQIEPVPGGSVFLFLDYPADFEESRRSWKADLVFDPDYNPVARRNLEQPYQRRIHSTLPGCQPI